MGGSDPGRNGTDNEVLHAMLLVRGSLDQALLYSMAYHTRNWLSIPRSACHMHLLRYLVLTGGVLVVEVPFNTNITGGQTSSNIFLMFCVDDPGSTSLLQKVPLWDNYCGIHKRFCKRLGC